MFNLESSIAEWRDQMLASGITSTDVDELESHLLEETKQAISSGQSELAAFQFAMFNLGKPQPLSREYKKADGLFHRFTGPANTRTERILALGWLIYCAGSLYITLKAICSARHLPPVSQPEQWFGLILTLLFMAIYARCGVSSILVLFQTARRPVERRLLWFLAIFEVIGAAGVLTASTRHVHAAFIIFAILGLISLWLLRPPAKPKAA